MEVLAGRNLWSDFIELVVFENHEHIRFVANNFEMVKVEPGQLMKSSFQLNATAAQKLIDSLWDCGLRPSSGSGSAGSLEATKYHLEDMRRLVFK